MVAHLVLISLSLVVLFLVIRFAYLFIIPKIIQDTVRTLELKKLVVIHDATVLKIKPTGLELRLRMNVLDTRLPLAWLRAGLAKPPTITISRIVESSNHSPPYPFAKAHLSDPITLTGLSDLWIWQDCIDVEITDESIVKGIVRKLSQQEWTTDGLIFQINLQATIQFMGYVLYDNLALEKIIDVTRNAGKPKLCHSLKFLTLAWLELKKETIELFEASKKRGELPATVPVAGIPKPLKDSYSADEALPGIMFSNHPSHPCQRGSQPKEPVNSSKEESKTQEAKPADLISKPPSFLRDISSKLLKFLDNFMGVDENYRAQLPVVPWREPAADGVFPDLKLNQQPVDTSMSGVSTGVSLTFSRPPSLWLKLGTISLDIQLNGSSVASATVTGLEFYHNSTRADIMIEIVPSVVKRPIVGLLSSARGVLRGALNGTVAGLVNGDWGSGATILRITNIKVENEDGRRVLWVDNVLESVVLEHDLDGVRRLGGAAKGAARDVKDTVWNVAAGVLASTGNRCNLM
ncbi:hypothetical protein HDU97_005378 [Phlyctochytrium planicorne]|nr:hypothetical protein HDU97_005378 [Phlyctochytrium planicorne]